MRNIVICIKLSRLCIFITIVIFLLGISFLGKSSFCNVQNLEKNNMETIIENVQSVENIDTVSNNQLVENNELAVDSKLNVIEEYRTMPRELKGYTVIGKIQIPKIELELYILSETNKNTLSVSATKLYGPEINKVGNFCIAGHNYNKMFGKIKNLEIKDNIILTDTYDNSITYEVYDIFQTSSKDVSCLNQETEGDRELTLITCTKGAIKRIIVKAVEVYD